jgi:hypothetical protein
VNPKLAGELDTLFQKIVALYTEAAKSKQSMLAVLV